MLGRLFFAKVSVGPRELRRSFDEHSGARSIACGILLAWFSIGCEPNLVVGTWTCPNPLEPDGDWRAVSVTTPWSSGFEDGICGYTRAAGFCYSFDQGSYDVVTSPVRSGARAAAFHVTTAESRDGAQARCVRQGVLPTEAYYGAWYLIPKAASAPDNWNLFHFQSGDADPLHGIWDVTITLDEAGALRLSVYDFMRTTWHNPSVSPEVPLGSWFRIQVYLKRAADSTGEFALYQDGRLLVELRGLVTDDSSYGRWFVGNLARSLTPPDSTIYVDDVTIAETL